MSVSVGALLAALVGAGPAHAACNVTTTAIAFGRYDVFSPAPLDSTGTVTVWCDEAPPANVTISVGPSANGRRFIPRKMKNASGSDLLDYNVFTNAGMSTVWGDGTSGTATVFLKLVKKNQPPVVTPIYGRIPPGQDVSVGPYGDTLTVTIAW